MLQSAIRAAVLALLVLAPPSVANGGPSPLSADAQTEAEKAARQDEAEEARDKAEQNRLRRMRGAARNIQNPNPAHDDASYDELDYEIERDTRAAEKLGDLEDFPSVPSDE